MRHAAVELLNKLSFKTKLLWQTCGVSFLNQGYLHKWKHLCKRKRKQVQILAWLGPGRAYKRSYHCRKEINKEEGKGGLMNCIECMESFWSNQVILTYAVPEITFSRMTGTRTVYWTRREKNQGWFPHRNTPQIKSLRQYFQCLKVCVSKRPSTLKLLNRQHVFTKK